MKQDLKVTIRPATDTDSAVIKDLIFDIWLNEYQFEVTQDDYPDLTAIEDSYLKSGGKFLVAETQNKIIGTIACEKIDNSSFVLKRMFVAKDFRGQGIAKKLLDRLITEIGAEMKDERVCFYLSTKKGEAIAAERFYARNGFREVQKAQLPKNFPYFYEDDLFMMRQL